MLPEDKLAILGFQPSKDLVCVLVSQSWCFCQALPSILFQVNDVIKFNCQKPVYKRNFEVT